MGGSAPRVFLSYRHDDAGEQTDRIHDRLSREFGPGLVAKDVTSGPIGKDWREWVRETISACEVMIVVVGPGWLGDAGEPRLEDPDDPIRIELEAGLASQTLVVPVLVRGATMPAPDQLPEPIRAFAYRNAVPVRRDPDFHSDVDRLLQGLPLEDRSGKGKRVLRLGVLIVAPFLLGALVWFAATAGGDGGDEDDSTTQSSTPTESTDVGVPTTSFTPESATTSKPSTTTPPTTPAPPPTVVSKIGPNEWLRPGEVLRSADGDHVLGIDGEGVLQVWTSGQSWGWTAPEDPDDGVPGSVLILQEDGNLVIYPSDSETSGDDALWSSGTKDAGGASLEVGGDAELGTVELRSEDGELVWAVALLPDVEGMSEFGARQELQDLGARARVSYASSDNVDEGRVISQAPSGGERSDVADLRVSTGPLLQAVPCPTSTEFVEFLWAPNAVGADDLRHVLTVSGGVVLGAVCRGGVVVGYGMFVVVPNSEPLRYALEGSPYYATREDACADAAGIASRGSVDTTEVRAALGC